MSDPSSDLFIHPHAICESDAVGPGTRIWAFAHVMAGARVGADCNLGNAVFVEAGCEIGDRVTVKNGVHLWEGTSLADDVMIGPCAVFTNDRFPRSPRGAAVGDRYRDKSWLEGVRVEQGATVGANATLCPGVTIGAYAMVAAGALVTRDVVPHALVGGHPAAQMGWVCRCGLRLEAAGETLHCSGCAARYREQDGSLNALDA